MLPLGQLADVIDLEFLFLIGHRAPIVGLIVGWALVGIRARRTHWHLCLCYYLVALILWVLPFIAILAAGANPILEFTICPIYLVGLSGPIVGVIATTSPSRVRSRYPSGHCQNCGYSLTGNVSGRCPECGIDAEEPLPEPVMRSRSGIAWSSFVLGIALVLLAAPVLGQDSLALIALWSAAIFACAVRILYLIQSNSRQGIEGDSQSDK